MTKSSSESVKAMIMPVRCRAEFPAPRRGRRPAPACSRGPSRPQAAPVHLVQLGQYLQNDVRQTEGDVRNKHGAEARLVVTPSSRPTNTNISMSEIPVMISGFIMGRFVTVFSAAAVFAAQLVHAHGGGGAHDGGQDGAQRARISVFRRAPSVFASRNSSLYQ